MLTPYTEGVCECALRVCVSVCVCVCSFVRVCVCGFLCARVNSLYKFVRAPFFALSRPTPIVGVKKLQQVTKTQLKGPPKKLSSKPASLLIGYSLPALASSQFASYPKKLKLVDCNESVSWQALIQVFLIHRVIRSATKARRSQN